MKEDEITIPLSDLIFGTRLGPSPVSASYLAGILTSYCFFWVFRTDRKE